MVDPSHPQDQAITKISKNPSYSVMKKCQSNSYIYIYSRSVLLPSHPNSQNSELLGRALLLPPCEDNLEWLKGCDVEASWDHTSCRYLWIVNLLFWNSIKHETWSPQSEYSTIRLISWRRISDSSWFHMSRFRHSCNFWPNTGILFILGHLKDIFGTRWRQIRSRSMGLGRGRSNIQGLDLGSFRFVAKKGPKASSLQIQRVI